VHKFKIERKIVRLQF